MITIKETQQAREDLKTINDAQYEFEKNCQEVRREINNKYYKLENELRDKKDKEYSKIDKDNSIINSKYEMSKENSIQAIKEFKEVINFLKIKDKYWCRGIKSPLVYEYDYLRNGKMYIEGEKQKIFYNPIEILIEDDFKKILLYITKNGKPKNCFSLIAVGNTKFNSDVFIDEKKQIPYSYGVHSLIDDANIISNVKDFPTEEEANNYVKKNRKRILKEFLKIHLEKEELYKSTIKEVADSKEWKIAVLEEDKSYYERNVIHGTEKEEYKEILKKLEELKDGNA